MNLETWIDRASNSLLNATKQASAVGYLGANIPVELILASGSVPVRLGVDAPTHADTSLADRFLENSFSLQSRLLAQQWLAGELDSLRSVIFSRSDDSAQRLYYYLCELQRMGECRGPKPLLYDLARIQRQTSLAHTIASTKLLAVELGVQDSLLNPAIQRVASRETLLDQLAELRASEHVPTGSLSYRIRTAARSDWSEGFDDLLQQWLAAPNTIQPRHRLLLVGSAPSDASLHTLLEVDGAVVVGEIDETFTASNPEPDPSLSGVEKIAHKYYRRTSAISSLLRSPAEIVGIARALRVDGVVLWMLATDTGLAWQAPHIANAFVAAGFPILVLTSQPQTPDAPTSAQLKKFAQTLEAR